jgi:hypothetical protein
MFPSLFMWHLEDFPHELEERWRGSDLPRSGESKELDANEIPRIQLEFPSKD